MKQCHNPHLLDCDVVFVWYLETTVGGCKKVQPKLVWGPDLRLTLLLAFLRSREMCNFVRTPDRKRDPIDRTGVGETDDRRYLFPVFWFSVLVQYCRWALSGAARRVFNPGRPD